MTKIKEAPVFYPTRKDMLGSFEKYIGKIESELAQHGIARIVPPRSWQPRQSGYKSLQFVSEQPIKQHVVGSKGFFRTVLVECKPTSIQKEFKVRAGAAENQPSQAALKDNSLLERGQMSVSLLLVIIFRDIQYDYRNWTKARSKRIRSSR
jgi:hypothetical protein